MKLTSPQTYKVIRFCLQAGLFKQTEAHKATGVAFSRVNTVVNWLVSRGFAARETGGYRVIAPAALLASFALFRQMRATRIGSFKVHVSEDSLKELLRETKASFCLTSALSYYDDYFRDPSHHVYGTKKLCERLSELPEGFTQVDVYTDDLAVPDDFIEDKNTRKTGRIRTLVDLACSERAYAAERLIKKTWA